MKYYYNQTTGKILVKTIDNGFSKRSNPFIITEQNINDFELHNWQINLETLQLESKNITI